VVLVLILFVQAVQSLGDWCGAQAEPPLTFHNNVPHHHIIMFRRTLIVSSALFATLPLAALAQDKPLKVGVTGGPARADPGAGEEGRREGRAEDPDRRVQRLRAAQRCAGRRRPGRQQLPAQALPRCSRWQDRGYKLAPVGYTVNFPIGLYSKKVKKLDELKEGARKFGHPQRPHQRRPRAAGAAGQGPDQAA
jgi:hypothetical protein